MNIFHFLNQILNHFVFEITRHTHVVGQHCTKLVKNCRNGTQNLHAAEQQAQVSKAQLVERTSQIPSESTSCFHLLVSSSGIVRNLEGLFLFGGGGWTRPDHLAGPGTGQERSK